VSAKLGQGLLGVLSARLLASVVLLGACLWGVKTGGIPQVLILGVCGRAVGVRCSGVAKRDQGRGGCRPCRRLRAGRGRSCAARRCPVGSRLS
jgi:hypothetical protein